jgi:hypothetical protein
VCASVCVKSRVGETAGSAAPYIDAAYAVLVCGAATASAFVSIFFGFWFWCCVLILLRLGSIRHEMYDPRYRRNDESNEGDARKTSEKSYELCAGAANHITSIGV